MTAQTVLILVCVSYSVYTW